MQGQLEWMAAWASGPGWLGAAVPPEPGPERTTVSAQPGSRGRSKGRACDVSVSHQTKTLDIQATSKQTTNQSFIHGLGLAKRTTNQNRQPTWLTWYEPGSPEQETNKTEGESEMFRSESSGKKDKTDSDSR